MCRILALLLVAVLTPLPAMAQESWSSDAALKAQIFALLHEYKPSKPIALTAQSEEWEFKGRFGKRVVQARSLYIPQEAGLIRIDSGRSAEGALQALVVCGLIPIEAERLAIGDATVGSKTRLTRLETTSSDLCRPVPGGQFSYRLQVESQLRLSSGYSSRTQATTDTYDVLCTGKTQFMPAQDVVPGLEGQALPVVCERKSGKGQSVTVEYAFLNASGFYLPLSEHGSTHKMQVRYTQARYRD